MGDPMWMAVPPGGYWEPDDDRIDWARIKDKEQSLADAITDSAIEEALLRRAERKERRMK